jgi:hypothetical protein
MAPYQGPRGQNTQGLLDKRLGIQLPPDQERAFNLATIRAAIIPAIKDAGYLHVPEGRRDLTTPAETLRLHGLD